MSKSISRRLKRGLERFRECKRPSIDSGPCRTCMYIASTTWSQFFTPINHILLLKISLLSWCCYLTFSVLQMILQKCRLHEVNCSVIAGVFGPCIHGRPGSAARLASWQCWNYWEQIKGRWAWSLPCKEQSTLKTLWCCTAPLHRSEFCLQHQGCLWGLCTCPGGTSCIKAATEINTNAQTGIKELEKGKL